LTVQPNAIDRLQLRDLEAAIATLPLEQRQVILLVGLEGMRYEEVAEVLNIPVGTVSTRLSRGRDQLRRLMDMTDKVPRLRHGSDEDLKSRRRVSLRRVA
jgi:RNA polymerase sigma-70 factor (ECF subfamily)